MGQEFARPRRGHPPVEVGDQVSGTRPARRFPSSRRGARCRGSPAAWRTHGLPPNDWRVRAAAAAGHPTHLGRRALRRRPVRRHGGGRPRRPVRAPAAVPASGAAGRPTGQPWSLPRTRGSCPRLPAARGAGLAAAGGGNPEPSFIRPSTSRGGPRRSSRPTPDRVDPDSGCRRSTAPEGLLAD